MLHFVRFALLMTAWLLTLGTAFAQSPLDKDERLNVSITLHHHVVSLSDLVRDLQRQTGVPMEAQRDIMDEKATVFVENKPARDVMEKLASVFLLRWEKRKPDGYRLTPDADARKWERDFLALRERISDRLWLEWIQKGYREVQRGWGWVQQQAERFHRLQDRLNEQGTWRQPSAGWELQYPVRDVYGFLAAQVLGRSPLFLWQRLKQGEVIIASTHPASGELPLYVPEEAVRELVGEEEPLPPSSQTVMRLFLQMSDNLDVRIVFQRGGVTKGMKGGVELPLSLQRHGSLLAHPLMKRWQDWQTAEEDLLKEPSLLKPFSQPLPEYPSRGYFGEWIDADLFCWLHTATGIAIIGDGSRQIRRHPVPSAETPAQWLQAIIRKDVTQNGYFVRYEEGYLLIRRKNYWQLRYSEIPERILLPLERRVLRGEALTLDDYAGLVAQLNQSQLLLLPERFITPVPELSMRIDQSNLFREDVPLLLLWASLSPAQKKALWDGEPLALASLSPPQRQLLLPILLSKRKERHWDEVLHGQAWLRMEAREDTLFVIRKQGEQILPVSASVLEGGADWHVAMCDDPILRIYLDAITASPVRSCRGKVISLSLVSGEQFLTGADFLLRTEPLPPLDPSELPVARGAHLVYQVTSGAPFIVWKRARWTRRWLPTKRPLPPLATSTSPR